MTSRTVDQSDLLIRGVSEITDEWLAQVLQRPDVTVSSVERIGTGQMSLTYRVGYTEGSTPATVVVKVAATNEASRNTGVGMGAYLREVAFYRELGGRIGGPLVGCRLAEYDATHGWFTLVLDDIADAEQGDQIAGCSVGQARTVLQALAHVHAPVINDLAVGTMEFLNQPNPINQTLMTAVLPGFLDRYAGQISDEHAEVCRRYVAVADAHAADLRTPLGLIHGDFRLDNLLLRGEHDCVIVDWQTVQWGPALVDVAYFLGGSVGVEDRRAHEHDLVRVYYDALIGAGVTNFSWQQCWDEYRRQVFWALAMVIVPAMVVERTDRGDQMFMALLGRVCAQILDLGSLDLLPATGAAPTALQPQPADEASHQPGAERFWNESWYFDAASDDGRTGVYVRLGHVPNLEGSIYSLAIVRSGQPTVMVTDYSCPHPTVDDDTQTVDGAGYTATQRCTTPLQSYDVHFEGVAQRFDDDRAPLRGDPGEPVTISVDLRWDSDAVPYAWRASTRYEIPCRVTGTITIDGTAIAFGGPGQRDHSWGARDWWANDWMWTAFHLEDGTRAHAVTTPDLPGYVVGYIQKDGTVAELTAGTADAKHTADGLTDHATLSFTAGTSHLDVEVEPLGYGGLRMRSPDDRIALFPRALARFTAQDGRQGFGWIEWNINQR